MTSGTNSTILALDVEKFTPKHKSLTKRSIKMQNEYSEIKMTSETLSHKESVCNAIIQNVNRLQELIEKANDLNLRVTLSQSSSKESKLSLFISETLLKNPG